MDTQPKTCLICGGDVKSELISPRHPVGVAGPADPMLYKIRCRNCPSYVPQYVIDEDAEEAIAEVEKHDGLIRKRFDRYFYEHPGLADALIARYPEHFEACTVLDMESAVGWFDKDGSPLDVYENTLIRMAEKSWMFGHAFKAKADRWVVPTMVDEEAGEILKGLKEEGYLAGAYASMDSWQLSLTIDGLRRAAELRRQVKASGSTVFVAACFKDELQEARDTIHRVIGEWGYHPKAVDQDCRDKLIDLRIYELIRESSFVVADLTWNRQSVYYEAGFAHGLGLEVVLTCRSDHFKSPKSEFKRVHFDLSHRPVIQWENEGHLAQELGKRIGQDFGRGPVVHQEAE